MPFKPKGTADDGDLSPLRTILNNTHLMQRDNPLYQFCNELLKRIQKSTGDLQAQVKTNTTAIDSITGGGSGGSPITPGADVNSDFITWADESASLPNSRNLVAGTGVTFDDSVANQRTINVASTAFYDSPLTDGDVLETDLIFAAGDCIIVQVPF